MFRSSLTFIKVFPAAGPQCVVQWLKKISDSFKFMWPCMVTNFFLIKPARCTNFTNLFCHETPHVSDSSSAHHQALFTIHSAMVYVIHVCRQLSSRTTWSRSKSVYKPVWHIPLLSVLWINTWLWTDELSETCRVSCQNKFVNLVHLVGFIIQKNNKEYLPTECILLVFN